MSREQKELDLFDSDKYIPFKLHASEFVAQEDGTYLEISSVTTDKMMNIVLSREEIRKLVLFLVDVAL